SCQIPSWMDFSHGRLVSSISSKTVNGRIYKSGKDKRANRSIQPESEKAREAANARERQRMNCINAGFDCLRKTLPKRGTTRKLSKAETLREAIQYIKKLHGVLIEEGMKEEKNMEGEAEGEGDNEKDPSIPSSFPWPITSISSISSIPNIPHSFSTPIMNSPSFSFSSMSLTSPAFPSRQYQIH
ncbi:hypothetical protein PENTCL1PPCAC_11619, partial [Pristionchus entomophagus]